MEKLEDKVNELLKSLDQEHNIIEMQKYKKRLLENEQLMKKIKKLQQLDIYSNEYKELKKELFQNSDFVAFKHFENEINMLIMQINSKLKFLLEERGYNCESN